MSALIKDIYPVIILKLNLDNKLNFLEKMN
jgi:hypothetical protein